MFTNRTRSYVRYDPGYLAWDRETVEFKRDAGSGFCAAPFEHRTFATSETLYPLRFSAGTIEDNDVIPKVRYRNLLHNLKSLRLPRSVKDVRHTKVELSAFKGEDTHIHPTQDEVTVVQNLDLSDSCVYTRKR